MYSRSIGHRGERGVTEIQDRSSPTTTGFAVKCAIALLERDRTPIEPILRRSGLSRDIRSQDPREVSALAQANFVEYAAEATGDSAFGLHSAELGNPRETGLLFYAVSAARTVGDGWKLLARYCRIVNESVRVDLKGQAESVTIEFGFVG